MHHTMNATEISISHETIKDENINILKALKFLSSPKMYFLNDKLN